MKSYRTAAVLILLMVIACTPGQREGARTALDLGQTLCVVANQLLSDTAVAKACGIAEALWGPMRDILSGARQESAKAAAAARTAGCASSDAGAPKP